MPGRQTRHSPLSLAELHPVGQGRLACASMGEVQRQPNFLLQGHPRYSEVRAPAKGGSSGGRGEGRMGSRAWVGVPVRSARTRATGAHSRGAPPDARRSRKHPAALNAVKIKLLGKGAFGQVTLALDQDSGQNVALKFIPRGGQVRAATKRGSSSSSTACHHATCQQQQSVQ